MNILQSVTSSHQSILDAVSHEIPFADPVAFSPAQYEWPLLKAAKKGRAFPIKGVLVPDWNPHVRKSYPGLVLGARMYSIEGITFVSVQFECDYNLINTAFHFYAVERNDYLRLFRIAHRCQRSCDPPSPPPVLSEEQLEIIWKNTIGYLESENLLIMHNIDHGQWDWKLALQQFQANRAKFQSRIRRQVGFNAAAANHNGNGDELY